MSIHLEPPSQTASSCLPGRHFARAALWASLVGISPDKAFLADPVTKVPGGLLHHRFTLTRARKTLRSLNGTVKMRAPGGLFLWSWLCIAAASR